MKTLYKITIVLSLLIVATATKQESVHACPPKPAMQFNLLGPQYAAQPACNQKQQFQMYQAPPQFQYQYAPQVQYQYAAPPQVQYQAAPPAYYGYQQPFYGAGPGYYGGFYGAAAPGINLNFRGAGPRYQGGPVCTPGKK